MFAVKDHPSRSPRKVGPRRAINRPPPLTQAYDQRDFAAKCALDLESIPCKTLEEKVARARALRDYNTVWDNCCERALVLRGHGKPRSVLAKNDVTVNKTKRTVRSAPIVLPAPPEQEKQQG